MTPAVKTGAPVLGIIFLVLAVVKLLAGDPWVVWAIIAFLFGGFRVFAGLRTEDRS